MGLFNKHETETVPARSATVSESPNRRTSMFGSHRRSAEADTVTRNNTTTTSPTRHHGGLLHRDHEDSSITTARERLLHAEAAERDADKALLSARAAVKDAREQIKRLEREAAEEARLAKIKQNQAASMSKRGNLLGRHDRH